METEDARVEELARKIAGNGASYLPRYQRALERAREILAKRELDKIETPGSPLYPWELGEPIHPPDAMPRLFTASVDLGATGEGVALQFVAGLAQDEIEFRRNLAIRVGPHVANAAEIRTGTVDLAPFSAMFVTPATKAAFAEADGGGMPTFSYFAQILVHYS